MIDVAQLFQDETIKSMPIIDVINVLTAIQKQEETTRLIIDKNQLKEEVVNHG